MRAAAVVKLTDRLFWQAAKPSPSAMWLLPVPELPIAMMFSRRSMYSERASSMTRALFNDGSAAKSKLSRLLTAGNLAALMRRSTMLYQLQLGQPQQIAGIIGALGGALACQLVVLAQERRQLERLEVMRQENLRGVGHAAAPLHRSM